jgi:hypothetical protein
LARKTLFLTKLDRFKSLSSVLLGVFFCSSSLAAFCQNVRTLLALSDLTIPSGGLGGTSLVTAVCNAATFSLIWNVEGEFRRLLPGEISRSVVSSAIAAKLLLLLVLLEMRNGETEGFGYCCVSERRRVLRLGGRFSESVIVTTALPLREDELRQTGLEGRLEWVTC